MTVGIGAIIFDFDGVLIESEALGNQQIAAFLTGAGYPTSVAVATERFMGLSGDAFTAAVERWIDGPLPADFAAARAAEDRRVMQDGIAAVAGAVAFVRSLPPALPKAIASSSSTAWIRRHLDHIGLSDAFGDHLYSGREHVAHGKPAPDIYLYAADRLGIPIADCLIVEDSVVGVTGAAASGGRVIGFAGGSHCGSGHRDRLRKAGAPAIAMDFRAVAALAGLDR